MTKLSMSEEEMLKRKYTRPYEKRIEKLEQENNKLLDVINNQDVKIADLEKENAELKETLKTYNGCGDWDNDFHTCRVYLRHEELQMYIDLLRKAKDLIENIIRVTWGEGWNYSLDWKAKAEQFLKEIEK